MSDFIMEIENVSKVFGSGDNKFYALDDVSFKIKKGETVGIVGESGSGKSTIAKIITKLFDKTEGKIIFDGKDITELKEKEFINVRKKIQMIMQNASDVFNPKMKVEEIVCEAMTNFGILSKKDRRKKAIELLEMVGLDESFCDRYPNEVSGGQLQRIATARAFSIHPEIIICDEACSALDVSVQKKIMDLFCELKKNHDIQYIFISHDLAVVDDFCDTTIIMYHGNILEVIRDNESIKKVAKHPYTKLLLESHLDVDCSICAKKFCESTKDVSATRQKEGCVFQNRCSSCMEICKTQKPKLIKLNENQEIACHLFTEKIDVMVSK